MSKEHMLQVLGGLLQRYPEFTVEERLALDEACSLLDQPESTVDWNKILEIVIYVVLAIVQNS